MNKYILTAFILVGSFLGGHAQTDAKAKAILAQVSKKYRSYDAIKADFTFTIENPQAKLKKSDNGILYARSKANKYKISMKDQDLISDGKTVWTHLKSEREVQLSEVDNSADALNPAKLFTIYETGYKYVYNGDTKVNGKIQHVIDLTPTDSKNSIFKIRLNVDKLTKHITNAVIFNKNGNRYSYSIKTFTPNVKVSDAIFVFDEKKHPGVNVEDLR